MTSKPVRLLAEVEVTDEHVASEYRHEVRCSEVPGTSETKKTHGAPRTAEIAKHAVSHWP